MHTVYTRLACWFDPNDYCHHGLRAWVYAHGDKPADEHTSKRQGAQETLPNQHHGKHRHDSWVTPPQEYATQRWTGGTTKMQQAEVRVCSSNIVSHVMASTGKVAVRRQRDLLMRRPT